MLSLATVPSLGLHRQACRRPLRALLLSKTPAPKLSCPLPKAPSRRGTVAHFQKESDAPTTASDAKVGAIMISEPIVFQSDMPVREAAKLMVEKSISGAPVVDAAGNLVGVLSESDLLWKGAGSPNDHWILPPVFIGAIDAYVYLRDNKQVEEEMHKILARTVSEAMTSENIASISQRGTLAEAASLMLQRKVNRLPVLEGKRVVGVVTRHDVLKGLITGKSPLL